MVSDLVAVESGTPIGGQGSSMPMHDVMCLFELQAGGVRLLVLQSDPKTQMGKLALVGRTGGNAVASVVQR
jgi:hypothetical protein